MDIKTANRLQQLRKMNGYSQDALAEQLGISRQAISKWERAESSPDTDNLIALAQLYGMTLDELLNSENDKVIIDPSPSEETVTEDKPVKRKRPSLHGKLGKKLFKFPYPIFVTIVYVLVGILAKVWHPTWLVFLTIPIYYHFAGACFTKSKKGFLLAQPIPEIIVLVFLLLGFCGSLWHPGWILFLLIPVYYWAIAMYVKVPKDAEEQEPIVENVETFSGDKK